MTRPMRGLLSCALALVVVACGGSEGFTPLPSGAEPPAECARPDDAGILALSADELAFDAACLVAFAGEAFTIHFTNLETEPHNVSIFSDPAKGSNLYLGDVITSQDGEIDYEVPALEEGLRLFECTVHPAMNGPIFVVAGPTT